MLHKKHRFTEALKVPLQLNWESVKQKEDNSLGGNSKHDTPTQGQTLPTLVPRIPFRSLKRSHNCFLSVMDSLCSSCQKGSAVEPLALRSRATHMQPAFVFGDKTNSALKGNL